MTIKRAPGVALYVVAFLLISVGARADLSVPGDFSTIQAAIDAASPGDVIHLAAGMYPETLTINKNLTLAGSGTNTSVIYSCPTNGSPLIAITGPATVSLSGFTLVGGIYMGPSLNYYNGFSPLGITSTNATLTLNSIVINQIQNGFVTIAGGALYATNMAIWTQDLLMSCDVGFQLNSCVAVIDGLGQDTGHIDHTININNPPAAFANVTVRNSRIRASRLDYGDCVRTYVNSTVTISNCLLYRGSDASESAVPAPGFNHNAIGENGYSNSVVITGNIISNLPCAIYCVGSLGGNQVVIESNTIINSTFTGIAWDAMGYKAFDLGGGPFGSRGGNVFLQLSSTNHGWDVVYTNLNGASPANIFALHNTWSNPTNKFAVIYDHLHQAAFGRLITDDLALAASGRDTAGRDVLSWNERGAGEQYTIQSSGTLAPGDWKNAPGAWPVINATLNPMTWTNPLPVTSNVFYRILSAVP